jgi:predicted DNA-binding protein (MmcQ/YjbR family)
MAKANPLARAQEALRKAALAYPETTEDHPWDHIAIKVKGKVFLFLGNDAEGLGMSMKLPDSHKHAVALPFAFPTPYNLGKSGWVSAKFSPGDEVPLEMLLEWLDESYRAIAPKRVLARLESAEGEPGSPPKKRRKGTR